VRREQGAVVLRALARMVRSLFTTRDWYMSCCACRTEANAPFFSDCRGGIAMSRLLLPTLVAAPTFTMLQGPAPTGACSSAEHPAVGTLRITYGAVACSSAEANRTVLG
jgi:hypothetical protein